MCHDRVAVFLNQETVEKARKWLVKHTMEMNKLIINYMNESNTEVINIDFDSEKDRIEIMNDCFLIVLKDIVIQLKMKSTICMIIKYKVGTNKIVWTNDKSIRIKKPMSVRVRT
jgi:hypothetical protein